MHSFETAFLVPCEDIECLTAGYAPLPWAEFWLNPRRLRGSDFLMRWSQGVWSEKRLIQAIDSTGRYFALPYGPSGTAPTDDVRAFELYFERLEAAGLGKVKRPDDLLLFRNTKRQKVEQCLDAIGGVKELPFTPEDDSHIADILFLDRMAEGK